MVVEVIKRDGRVVPFDKNRITQAIVRAALAVSSDVDETIARDLADCVTWYLNGKYTKVEPPTVEQVQDAVEKILIENGHSATAKAYILYRAERNRTRDMNDSLMKTYEDLTFKFSKDLDIKRENANINTDTAMGTMLKYGSEGAKKFNHLYLLDKDVSEAHLNGDIHIHDLDFYALTETCDQIDLDKLFKGGFSTGHGYLREPNDIRSYGALACIAIQSNQNDMHGGQSIPAFDYYMAPGVAKTMITELCRVIDTLFDVDVTGLKEKLKEVQKEHTLVLNDECKQKIFEIVADYLTQNSSESCDLDYFDMHIWKKALQYTNRDTEQAMEAVVHNLNSMHCLPASERIWVWDKKSNDLRIISMQELHDTFNDREYYAISINNNSFKAELKKITAVKDMGANRELVTLKTKSGATVTVTDNHRVMTLEGTELKAMYPDNVENLLAPRGIKIPLANNDICLDNYGETYANSRYLDSHLPVTVTLAELLGIFVADGSIIGNDSVLCLTTCEKYSNDYLYNLIQDAFSTDFSASIQHYTDSNGYDREKELRVNVGVRIGRMFKDLCGANSHEKRIPKCIMQGTDDIKIAFLSAYLNTDGRQTSNYAEVSSVSRELIKQINLLILSLGELGYQTLNNRDCGYDTDSVFYGFSLGNKSCKRMGIHRDGDSAFEIPKYDLSYVRDLIPRGYKTVIAKRQSGQIYYHELDTLVDTCDMRLLDRYRNIFKVDVVDCTHSNSGDEHVFDISVEDNETFLTESGVYVHNSRAGSQVPFSSINYGTCTSDEGRMVIRAILLATWNGLGNGEIPIFPIQIWKMKSGVSVDEGDPNYDLFKLACKVSAKRMFPNFSNLDAPYNAQYLKEGNIDTEIAYMGCVAGEEVVSYKIDNALYVEGIGTAYDRLSNLYDVKTYGISNYVDLESCNVEIYDTVTGGFVKVKKWIQNPDRANWNLVKLSGGRSLLATSDHPLPVVDKGRTFVSDLVVGDKIPLSNYNAEVKTFATAEVMSVEHSDYNGFSYDVETVSDRFDVSGICSHNCRTRVIGNVYDPSREIVTGRGNLSFTSINLPRLAIKSGKGNVAGFFVLLDEMMLLVKKQLLKRMQLQMSKHVYNYPFLMGEGNWIDSEKLKFTDKLGDILKHGSISIGFIGLAETLILLTGEHHGESTKAQELGLKIIRHMREMTDNWSAQEHLNYGVLATPAEGLSGRFVAIDRRKYGVIERVTDKDYYTNSFHVPVYYSISAYDKLKIEAPYHELTNAGHISYVEMDGDPLKNLSAFEDIVHAMHDLGIGYGAINHAVDRDPVCGYTGIIDDVCPRCGRHEGEAITEEKLEELKKRYRDIPCCR